MAARTLSALPLLLALPGSVPAEEMSHDAFLDACLRWVIGLTDTKAVLYCKCLYHAIKIDGPKGLDTEIALHMATWNLDDGLSAMPKYPADKTDEAFVAQDYLKELMPICLTGAVQGRLDDAGVPTD